MKWHEKPLITEATVILGLLASISLSFPLWLSGHALPLAPLFFSGSLLPSPFDAVFLLVLCLSALVALAVPRSPTPLLFILGSLGLLLFLDQHRLQAWVLIAVFFLIGSYLIRKRPTEARRETIHDLFRLIIILVFAWSALQKLNVTFLTSLGPQLASAFPIIGASLITPFNYAFLAPLVGLFIAGGLLFPKTRRAAVTLGCIYQLFAFLLLGPFGTNSASWPWSLAIAILLVVLFWNSKATLPLREMVRTRHPFTITVWLFFGLLPAMSFIGAWDSTLSFAVHSGNVRSAEFVMDPALLRQLPPSVWPFAKREKNGDARLALDDMFEELANVPGYPQERVFRSDLRWLCEKTDGNVKMDMLGRPHWLTKQREKKSLTCDDLK